MFTILPDAWEIARCTEWIFFSEDSALCLRGISRHNKASKNASSDNMIVRKSFRVIRLPAPKNQRLDLCPQNRKG
jgi:hypothetical protein